jgi:hypothetical protein
MKDATALQVAQFQQELASAVNTSLHSLSEKDRRGLSWFCADIERQKRTFPNVDGRFKPTRQELEELVDASLVLLNDVKNGASIEFV